MKDSAKNSSRWDELRRKAETLIDEHSSTADRFPDTDILHLIHELEVHDVELEIQGEELRLKNIELQEVMHRYWDLYNNAPAGFVSLSKKGVIIEANHAALRMLEIPANVLRNLGFSRLIHIEDQRKYLGYFNKLNKKPRGKVQGELRLLRNSAEPFYVHIEVVPWKDDRMEVKWLVAFIDISGRKKAEEDLHEACARLEESGKRLKGLSARLLSVQEEERQRIARELHDSFGQTLAAMKFNVEHALSSRDAHCSEDVFSMLERLIPIVQNAIEEVRNICMGLRPPTLEDLGILATLREFCREFETIFPNIHAEISTQIEENDIPEELKIVIFRIVQEAFNNVAKHSGAKRVDLSLVGSQDSIELAIQDDGIGFDFEALQKGEHPAGIGLAGMKERAEISGGTLLVESATRHGTNVRVRWEISGEG